MPEPTRELATVPAGPDGPTPVDAVRWAWHEHGLVVEPGAAVSMAALLAGKVEVVSETVAVLSGGNIDPELHAKLVA